MCTLDAALILSVTCTMNGCSRGNTPNSALPFLTNTVLVDGWSQGGAGYPGSPRIMLDGVHVPSGSGLEVFDAPAVPDGCVIRGLAQDQPGVYVDGFRGYDAIGGLTWDAPVDVLHTVTVTP